MKRVSSFQWPALALILLLAGCASTDTWENYSESEIAAWKSLNIDAATAHKFTKADLHAVAVRAWYREGFQDTSDIIDWSDEGFSAANAGDWRRAGFDLGTAEDWAEEKFSAEEARRWMKGGFDLDEAMENRSKGLSPVR